MTTITTHTLDAPGAVLTYDIRSSGPSTQPILLAIGSPMTADGFAALADRFSDRTVVTCDPRGAGRSRRTDRALETTPDEHADDLHRLISAVSRDAVDIFASSGGALNALTLVARHPEGVRTLVAHEPAAFQSLPDREQVVAAAADIHETYLRDGFGPGMAKFIALVGVEGPLGDDYGARPAPDPAAFGLPTTDDGSRDDPLLGLNMMPLAHHRLDVETLRTVSTRIVVGVSAVSSRSVAGRAALAVAEQLGTPAVVFPGGHGGFLEGEMNQGGGPDAFAAILSEVLVGEGTAVAAGR